MKTCRTIALVMTALVCSAEAAVIEVPFDQPTIQAGLNAASEGDTVQVAAGTYTGNLFFPGTNLVLSGAGMNQTILRSADYNYALVRIFSGETNATVVEGFTFRDSGPASAMQIEGSSPVIRYNRFTECNADADWGGPSIVSVFADAAPSIHHNLFDHNTGGFAALSVSGAARVYNNTIYDVRRFGVYTYHDSAVVVNNIAIACGQDGFKASGTALMDYNMELFNHVTVIDGPNYFTIGPLFVDSANGDFSLQINSPLRDAGYPDPDYYDIDGTPADIGAFPALGEPPLAYGIDITLPDFSWQYADTGAGSPQLAWELEVGTDRDWTVAEVWSSGEVVASVHSGIYGGPVPDVRDLTYYRLRLRNANGWGSWVEGIYTPEPVGTATIRVPDDLSTLQEAIFAAGSGDTILLTEPSYSGQGNRDLNFYGRSLVLMADPDLEETPVVDCGGSLTAPHGFLHLRNGEGPGSLIQGIGITAGYVKSGLYRQGGTIQLETKIEMRDCSIEYSGTDGIASADNYDSLTLKRVAINGSEANGISVHGPKVILDSCVISENGLNGVYAQWSSPVRMTNCFISDNAGAGLYVIHMMVNYGLHVENCTFVNNGHGFVYDWDWAKNENTPEQGDTAYVAANIFAVNDSVGFRAVAPFEYDVECNDFWGNAGEDFIFDGNGDTTGNFNVDPMFCDTSTGNYRLDEISPLAPANNACSVLIGALEPGCDCCELRGDANHDGTVVITDLTYLVDLLFRGGPAAPCFEESDANADGTFAINDLVFLVDFLFRGGSEPPACP